MNDEDLTPPPSDDYRPEVLKRLSKDIRTAAKTLTIPQARFLVDAYYQMQRDRIRASHQARTLGKNEEPHEAINWLFDQSQMLELSIKNVLHVYARNQVVGKWALSLCGIGPVSAAGLLAHLTVEPWHCVNPDRNRATTPCYDGKSCSPACHKTINNTVGHWWRFAGLDPTVKWEKSTKRPWNGQLKRLCWIIGESFTKNYKRDNDVYGKFYVARKAMEEARNNLKGYADQAKASLEQKNWRKDTSTRSYYEQGMLPPARIHLRAQRYAVKLFLSHYHHVAYYHRFKKHPPKPYVIGILGHVDEVPVPNWPFD